MNYCKIDQLYWSASVEGLVIKGSPYIHLLAHAVFTAFTLAVSYHCCKKEKKVLYSQLCIQKAPYSITVVHLCIYNINTRLLLKHFELSTEV